MVGLLVGGMGVVEGKGTGGVGRGVGLEVGDPHMVVLANKIEPGNSDVSCLLIQSGSSGLPHTLQATDKYCTNSPFIEKILVPRGSRRPNKTKS